MTEVSQSQSFNNCRNTEAHGRDVQNLVRIVLSLRSFPLGPIRNVVGGTLKEASFDSSFTYCRINLVSGRYGVLRGLPGIVPKVVS